MGHPPPRGNGESELTIVIVDLRSTDRRDVWWLHYNGTEQGSEHERDEQQPRTNKCKRAEAVVRSKNKEVDLDTADFLRDVFIY